MSSTADPLSFFLVFIFALSSWIAINGVWAQLPAFLHAGLPEGLALPSWLALTLQLSNVFPALYALYICTTSPASKGPAPLRVLTILYVGAVSCWLLGLFWQRVVYIAGVPHSLGLIVLTFTLGSVDCMTSLVFLPVMDSLPRCLATAFAMGEGATGLLSALVALVFSSLLSSAASVTWYFQVLALVTISSGVAYCFLLRVRFETDRTQLLEEDSAEPSSVSITWVHHAIMFAINFVQNGVMASITTYLYYPYTHGALLYKWSVWLGLALDPLVSALTLLPRHATLLPLTAVWSGLTVLLVVNTCLPSRIGQDSLFVGWLVVIISCIRGGLISYSKTSIYHLAKRSLQGEDTPSGQRLFVLIGVMQQAGSLAGSVLMFLLINYTAVFR